MAKANPVNAAPTEEVKEGEGTPHKDVRRPDLEKEVSGSDKPKNTYKMGDTVVEDY
jgi:hypothetical protein